MGMNKERAKNSLCLFSNNLFDIMKKAKGMIK